MASTLTPTWRQTQLWTLLQSRIETPDHPILRLVQSCLEKTESVLAKGGTSLPDFTLHDHEHGFRVAQKIAQLMPQEMIEAITSFEIALLLLAAYLHDIGMVSRRSIVQAHHKYLLTADNTLLHKADIERLEDWLDDEQGGLDLPVPRGNLTVGHIEKADFLLAYYCRHRHNDWGELWIREELSELTPSMYPGWMQDIVTLCRSHHEGLHDLRAVRFDAKIVGSPSQIVNLRYLAALLRTADILEFDPERTPEIILRHRSIAPTSKIFWAKDHTISINTDAVAGQIIISARTPYAQIHRAVLQTIDD